MSKTQEPDRRRKRATEGRKASGVRLPVDVLRAVRIYAAERDLKDWEAQAILLRKALGMPAPTNEEE